MCECIGEQDFSKCNCEGLFRIKYSHKGENHLTNYKFRDVINFKRWCEINCIAHKEFTNFELVE